MNKRRSTYCELSVGESRAMRSMRSGRWLRPSRIAWAGVLARFSNSSPAVVAPAGAALAGPAAHGAQPAAQDAQAADDRSMGAVVVIAVAVTVLAISVLVGTEVVLRALGRTSFISEFVGSPSTNPGYIYHLILIAIAVLGASLGTALLIVSAIVGVRLERRQGIVLGSDADSAGDSGGAGAAGALGAAVASRFAPPASAEPAQLFTPPDSLETAPR